MKSILVTGASSGIGKAIAVYLAEKGYHVIMVARNLEKLEEIKLNSEGKMSIFSYDLMNLHDIAKIFDFCSEKNIKLDGMVCAAGVASAMPVKVCDSLKLEETMRVNFESAVMLSKIFIKKKISHDGASMVFISSLATQGCEKGQVAYAASKASVESFVKVLSKEVIARDIRVNAVAPALVNTPMMNGETSVIKYKAEEVEKYQCLGVIDPVNIAYLVEFLLSDKSKYITGTTIPVNGGSM